MVNCTKIENFVYFYNIQSSIKNDNELNGNVSAFVSVNVMPLMLGIWNSKRPTDLYIDTRHQWHPSQTRRYPGSTLRGEQNIQATGNVTTSQTASTHFISSPEQRGQLPPHSHMSDHGERLL